MPSLLPPHIDPNEKLLPRQKQSSGPLIGTIIVITLLAIGGLYFWGDYRSMHAANTASTPASGAIVNQ